MNDSTQLSESQIKAIEREAEKAAEIAWEHLKGKNDSSPLVWVAGYTEGLTAERLKAKALIEALKLIEQCSDMGSYESAVVYMKSKAIEAISEYNKAL